MTGKKLQIDTIEVTPELAERWLGKNLNNRTIRERIVSAYARDMAAGNWHLTGEAIKFSTAGRLVDGQHRLHAVIQAGIAVWMVIIRGVDDAVQEVIDSGVGRTAGDALRMRGEPNYSSLAATARAAILFEARPITNNFKPSHSEIIVFIDNNKDLRPAVEMACSYRKAIDIPVSLLGLSIWRLSRVDADEATLFFCQLAEKTHLRAGDPVLALLNRLTDIRRNGRLATSRDYLSLVFRTWNYWRSRKPVQLLPLSTRTGSVDIPEPK